MSEFKIGDIVRMTKGELDKPGYRVEVRSVTEGISESPEVNFRLLKTFENAGWKIELIERPPPSTAGREGDTMTEFKPGDIVRLTKGEPDEPGYKCEVRTVAEGFPAHPGVNQYGLRTFEHEGWTVELISRPLPTTPNTLGWATVYGERRLARYRSDGEWELYSDQGWYKGYALARDLGDFTEAVLIPKELAGKIMEWVDDKGGEWHAGGILERIADHLKGQNDE